MELWFPDNRRGIILPLFSFFIKINKKVILIHYVNNTLIGIVIGLMIALSVVYFIETIEEFREDDLLKGVFFLVVTSAYLRLSFVLLSSKKIYLYITLVGSIGLFILYMATRESIDDIGELGIISKSLQLGVITGLVVLIRKN